MTKSSKLLLSASALALGGCVNLNEPISTQYGKFQETNMAAQIVDPAAAEGAPMMDAQKADAAIERYRTDTIKEPEESAGVEFGSGGGS